MMRRNDYGSHECFYKVKQGNKTTLVPVVTLKDRFQWGEDCYSLRQFVHQYENHLPQVVSIEDGYCSRDENAHEFSSDEIYWVRAVERQSRVILLDSWKRYLSVPFSYPGTFQVRSSNGDLSAKVHLREAVTHCKDSDSKILFADDKPVTFHKGAEYKETEKMGLLTIHDVFEQIYLVAHSFITETVCDGADMVLLEAIHIPAYVPIEVTVADGLTHGNPANYAVFNASIRQFVSKYKLKEFELAKDVMMFDETPGSDYDYIFPPLPSQVTVPHGRVSEAAYADSPAARTADGAPPVPPRTRSVDDGSDEELIEIPSKPWQSELKGKKLFFPPAPPPPVDNNIYEDVLKVLGELRPSKDVFDMKVAVIEEVKKMDELAVGEFAKLLQTIKSSPPSSLPQLPPIRKQAIVSPTIHKERRPPPVATKTEAKKGFWTRSLSKPQEKNFRSEKDKLKHFPSCAQAPESKWACASDIPFNVKDFSVNDVVLTLNLLGMGKHAEKMKSESVNGSLLVTIDEDVLFSELGFSRFEARKLHHFVANNWRP